MANIPPVLDDLSLRRQLSDRHEISGLDGDRPEAWRHREAVADRLATEREVWSGEPRAVHAPLDLPTVPECPVIDDSAQRAAVDELAEVPPFHYQAGMRQRLSRGIAGVVLKLVRFVVDAQQRLLHGLLDRHEESRRSLADLTASVEQLTRVVEGLGERLDTLEAAAHAATGERLDLGVELAEARADHSFVEAVVEVTVERVSRELDGAR